MPTQMFNHIENGDYVQDSSTGRIGVVLRVGNFRVDGRYVDAVECRDVSNNQKFSIPDGRIVHVMATSGRLKAVSINYDLISKCLSECLDILETDTTPSVWEMVERVLYPVFIILEKQDIAPVSFALDQIRVSIPDMVNTTIEALEYVEELLEYGNYGYP